VIVGRFRDPGFPVGAFLGVVVGAVLVVATYVLAGLPRAVPEPDVGRLDCVSYAHPSPLFGRGEPITDAVLRAELARVASIARCVRLYATENGQDAAVRIAAELGLSVLLGAWIDADPERSRAEIERAVALVEANRSNVRALIVGNEVMLRREVSTADMLALIEEVRARVEVPVTTAEIWTTWLRRPEMAQAVDVLTVHILPYWEGAWPDLDAAVAEVDHAMSTLAARFPGKPLLIGEVGWPSRGKARGPFAPGLVEQARFVRAVADLAQRRGWSYNIVEAFEQPWKRPIEGTVGDAWGVLRPDGTPKGVLARPVSPIPDWPLRTFAAVVLGVALILAARRARETVRPFLAGIAAMGFGALWIEQTLFAVETVALALALALSAALGAASLWLCAVAVRRIAGAPPVACWSLSTLAAFAAGHGPAFALWPAIAGLVGGGIRIGAAIVALALVADPRYRDFAGPAFLVVGLALPLALAPTVRPGAADRLVAILTAGGGLVALALAGSGNLQALGWAATALLIAASGLGLRVPIVLRRQRDEAEQQARPAERGFAESEGGRAG
jgi:exo-beta-1,3-glucanase (GH17 family)